MSDEPRTYAYRLKLRDESGRTIERDGVVSTKRYHVNGEGCDPATANAVLDVDTAGTVNVSYLS